MADIKHYVIYNGDTGDIIRNKTLKSNTLDAYMQSQSKFGNVQYIEKTLNNLDAWCVNVSVTPHVVEKKTLPAFDHWVSLRTKRTNLLKACDWTQAPDSPLSDAKKTEWATYRQALRDVPTNTTDPKVVVWPTEPS